MFKPQLRPKISYSQFLQSKMQLSGQYGFESNFIPKAAFPFQEHLIRWACRKGRAAEFADCGLGKTVMQLACAQNVVERENKPVLILAPLAVGPQTVREGAKFGIEALHCRDGKFNGAKIVITNYQRLKHFNRHNFAAVICDESGILKNFDGKIKAEVTEFMREIKYRWLFTAVAAPNDFTELGTSSEALGELGYMDMLGRFFKNDQNVIKPMTYRHRGQNFEQLTSGKWRFKGHAERDFWRWVCSWARSIRKPSDLGFEDTGFKLPKLITNQHIVKASTVNPDFLFDMPAISLEEQRSERRRTMKERCEMAARIAVKDKSSIILWGFLNAECDLMEKLIPDSKQISGEETDEEKEELLQAFASGEIKRLISKPAICGYGLNWQHCHRMTYFPSHSFEQWYQSIRRLWRFGQKHNVTADVITSEGESRVLKNLQRKEAAANNMFEKIVLLMGNELKLQKTNQFTKKEKVPSWL